MNWDARFLVAIFIGNFSKEKNILKPYTWKSSRLISAVTFPSFNLKQKKKRKKEKLEPRKSIKNNTSPVVFFRGSVRKRWADGESLQYGRRDELCRRRLDVTVANGSVKATLPWRKKRYDAYCITVCFMSPKYGRRGRRQVLRLLF